MGMGLGLCVRGSLREYESEGPQARGRESLKWSEDEGTAAASRREGLGWQRRVSLLGTCVNTTRREHREN